VVWRKALDLADRMYDVTEPWPARETYGLSRQVRRAAASVPANIAEGQGRRSPGDFARFLGIAYGSLCELETHLYLAERRNMLDRETLEEIVADSDEVARLIRGLNQTIRSQGEIREVHPVYDASSEDETIADMALPASRSHVSRLTSHV